LTGFLKGIKILDRRRSEGKGRMRSKVKVISIIIFISWAYLSNITFSEEKRGKLRLSIKLTGGWGYTSIGDINSHLESFNNYVNNYARYYGRESITGGIEKLDNFMHDWEAELRLELSPKFALGISTSGASHKKNESSLTYREGVLSAPEHPIYGEWIYTYTFKSEVKAQMPVRLSIYYRLPFVFKTNIIFYSGIGYYSANVSKYEKLDLSIDSEYPSWRWEHWKTDHKANLGFHGGIGMECSLTKNLALVLEAQGRYVKIKNLRGTLQREDSHNGGKIYEEKGTLWYFKWAWYGKGYYRLDISEESPSRWGTPPGYSISNVRKAIIDLSGYSIRIGLRIRLF